MAGIDGGAAGSDGMTVWTGGMKSGGLPGLKREFLALAPAVSANIGAGFGRSFASSSRSARSGW